MGARILLVSIAFPPKSDPESIQVGRYVKYLIKHDHDIEVVTSSNPTLYMEVDDNLSSMSEGIHKTTEARLFENRYLNYLIRKTFPILLEFPDPKYSFHLKVPIVNKPDILYSRSYPISSTILALKFKKKWPDVPWVLHLSDPWAISYEGDSPATNFHKLSKKWNQKKEHECFKLADKISFTSKKTIDLYSEHYPHVKNKFLLTPNVYDDEYLNEEDVSFTNYLNIVYTGGFGQKRDPLFYLESIKEFLNQKSSLKTNINFWFSGPLTQDNKNKFKRYKDVTEIKHLGLLDYNKMIELQNRAHILVNIDTDIKDPKHSVFFPSKLLEYFAANRRILAITNKHSVTHQVIHNKFGDCVEFDSKKNLIKLFEKYCEEFENRNSHFFVLNNEIEKYSAKVNTDNLINHFNQLS